MPPNQILEKSPSGGVEEVSRQLEVPTPGDQMEVSEPEPDFSSHLEKTKKGKSQPAQEESLESSQPEKKFLEKAADICDTLEELYTEKGIFGIAVAKGDRVETVAVAYNQDFEDANHLPGPQVHIDYEDHLDYILGPLYLSCYCGESGQLFTKQNIVYTEPVELLPGKEMPNEIYSPAVMAPGLKKCYQAHLEKP